MTEPWHHSGRTVNGDSAFAKVQTAVELKSHGMFFKGMVKTAHYGFPKTYLDTVEYPEHGDWITLAATVQGHCIFATGWGDMTVRTLCILMECLERVHHMARGDVVSVRMYLALKLLLGTPSDQRW